MALVSMNMHASMNMFKCSRMCSKLHVKSTMEIKKLVAKFEIFQTYSSYKNYGKFHLVSHNSKCSPFLKIILIPSYFSSIRSILIEEILRKSGFRIIHHNQNSPTPTRDNF